MSWSWSHTYGGGSIEKEKRKSTKVRNFKIAWKSCVACSTYEGERVGVCACVYGCMYLCVYCYMRICVNFYKIPTQGAHVRVPFHDIFCFARVTARSVA